MLRFYGSVVATKRMPQNMIPLIWRMEKGIGVQMNGDAEGMDEADAGAQRADPRVGYSGVHGTLRELEEGSVRRINPRKGLDGAKCRQNRLRCLSFLIPPP